MGYESFLGVNIWTALFTLANTVALFLVLKRFLFQPVMKVIEDRQQEIDSMFREAEDARSQAAALQSDYQQKLSAAQQTSDRMVKEAAARATARQEEILRQAGAEAAAMLEKANADIAQEKKKAINDAKDEISDIALAIAGKVVGRELQSADHEALISDFIDRLGE